MMILNDPHDVDPDEVHVDETMMMILDEVQVDETMMMILDAVQVSR